MSPLRGYVLLLAGLSLALAVPARSQPPKKTETTSLVFSRDGKTLFSASLDGTIRTWDVAQGKERLQVAAHRQGVYGLALSPDGNLLASAGGDGGVRVWDAARLKDPQGLTGHTKEATAVAFAPDGKVLASGSYDGTIRLWDLATGKELRVLQGDPNQITSIAFSPDGKALACGGTALTVIQRVGVAETDRIRLWDVASGKELRKLQGRGSVVAFAADGRTLAAGGYSILPKAPDDPEAARVNGVAIKPANRIHLWSVATGKEWVHLEGMGSAVAFSPDGRFLASGRGSETHLAQTDLSRHQGARAVFGMVEKNPGIRLWEVATGKEVLHVPVADDSATVLALSPDGTRLAAGRKDGSVQVVELAPKGWKAEQAGNLGPKDLDRRWAALAGVDAAAAYAAMWSLAAAGDQAVAFVKDRLRAVSTSDAERLTRLIADLDSNRFAVREKATEELEKEGELAKPALLQALAGMPSAEVRQRIEQLLEKLDGAVTSSEALRSLRAVKVLEDIGTAAARQVLDGLARGAAGARLTQEAKTALERLARRSATTP
jgi:WD40 repeat protein